MDVFSPLNEQTATRWKKTLIKPGLNTFTWHYNASHATACWQFYITNKDWNPNRPLSRESFELKPLLDEKWNNTVPVPAGGTTPHKVYIPADHGGYHVILATWKAADTDATFYQVIDLDIDNGGTDSWRSYSFANRPGNQLQFLVRLLPDGVMSNYLRERCQVGDEMLLEAPLGAFYLRHVTQPLVLVAGGTGLSALLGMLDELAASGCVQTVHLYYGVRGAEDLCEAARIQAYAAKIPDFRYTEVLSAPSEDWPGKRGYLTEHFDLAELRDRSADMYVCGPPPMVESIQQWLADQALDGVQLYYEKFTQSNI